jgi:hypothetical protein
MDYCGETRWECIHVHPKSHVHLGTIADVTTHRMPFIHYQVLFPDGGTGVLQAASM